MSFNSDPNKLAQEIIFSRETKKISHPSLHFNNGIVSQSQYQKHLGLFPDAQFTFEEHLKAIATKVNKTIGLIRNCKIKYFAKTGINNDIQSFDGITSRLW